MPALDLLPGTALPCTEIDLFQPVVDLQRGAGEAGKVRGHFAATPQGARPDRQRRRRWEREEELTRVQASVLPRGHVEPSVAVLLERDWCMTRTAEERRHRRSPPCQSTSVRSRVHSRACSVAPRKSPVSPPARRTKRMPQMTAVSVATATRPASTPQSRNFPATAPPKRRATQPLATATCEPPARAMLLLFAPSGDTEGKSAILQT